MNYYHVTLRTDGHWQAHREGKDFPLLVSENRDEMLEDILELGKAMGNTCVLVHAPGGGYEEQHTFLDRPFGGPRSREALGGRRSARPHK